MNTFFLPEELDSLLLSSPVNVHYLTGFTSVNTQEREAYVFITHASWYLITYRLYHEEAEHIVKQHSHITPLYIGGGIRLSDHLKTITLRENIKTVGIETSSLTVSEYDQLYSTFPFLRFIKGTQWLEPSRLYKSDAEITTIRKACTITDACFSYIQKKITTGITEKQLALELELYIKDHGAALSFAPIVAFNEHSSTPHHMPGSDKPLTANSLLLFDFGAMVDGYHADMTRVIFFGTPKPEWIKAYRVVLAAQQKAREYLEKTTQPHGAEADRIAQKVITDAGYPQYPHGLGHGVGMEIHESPRLSIYRDELLQTGMVFSIEPGIYLPGKFGIRIEDLAVKTDTGIELLSHSPYLL